VKKALDEDNQSLANIDSSAGQFCLAGLVRGTDPGPNREVRFEYRSQGTIKQATAKRATGDFDTVDLTLTIEDSSGTLFGPTTLSSACSLRGKVLKTGEKSRVRVKCDLGEFFSAFGLSDEFRDNVRAAFPRADNKHVRLNIPKGKALFIQTGEEAPETVEVEVSCDLPTPG
jgi:hypothetical protein